MLPGDQAGLLDGLARRRRPTGWQYALGVAVVVALVAYLVISAPHPSSQSDSRRACQLFDREMDASAAAQGTYAQLALAPAAAKAREAKVVGKGQVDVLAGDFARVSIAQIGRDWPGMAQALARVNRDCESIIGRPHRLIQPQT